MHLTTCEQCTRILKAAKGDSLTVSLILGRTHDGSIVSFLRGGNRLRKVQGLDSKPTASKQLIEELCLGSTIKFSPPHSIAQPPQGGCGQVLYSRPPKPPSALESRLPLCRKPSQEMSFNNSVGTRPHKA